MIDVQAHVRSCLATYVNGSDVFFFQDYHSFFEAVETERLFQYLDLEVPEDEVEFQLKAIAPAQADDVTPAAEQEDGAEEEQ